MKRYHLTVKTPQDGYYTYDMSLFDMTKIEARDSGVLFIRYSDGVRHAIFAPGAWMQADIEEVEL